MAALARELKARKDIISLSLGEPDFNTQTLSKKQLKSDRRKLQHDMLS
jgi:aspartate/methionine/tyrosine aminotransferase